MRSFITLALLGTCIHAIGQETLVSEPRQAQFVYSDIENFWAAYDEFNANGGNPFKEYLDKGSAGLKDFIPYRIESPGNLKKTVKKKAAEYKSIREESVKIKSSFEQTYVHYEVFKEIYDEAVFPTTFFVIGAFNSGGTASKNGLIIGVEMQKDISNIPYIVAHELIHFNQNYSAGRATLLKQSIMEGSADFIGELISGKHINEKAAKFGNANEAVLCKEFVTIMDDDKYNGWLYGSTGKKEGRPNDLGYWIGYRISKAYYDKQSDKKQAIVDILNISDFEDFLNQSGYLSEYLTE